MNTDSTAHVAIKLFYEAEVDRLVERGFAEKGELIFSVDETTEQVSLKITTDRKIVDILKAACPEKFETELIPKPPKIIESDIRPLNRAERRAARERR